MPDLIILDEEKNTQEPQDSAVIADDQVRESSMAKETGGSFMDKINATLLKFQHLKIKEKVVFYRLLSTMLNAGMPLLK